NRYRLKQKANKQLQKQKDEIANQKNKVEKAHNELSDAYSKLKELENFKESMTGMIVHDLKNPLNTILSMTLEQPSLNETQHIQQAGNQMLNMTMNILDVQKFEDANYKPAVEENTYSTFSV
ncbi:MAG: HAMP domain-containing histidine kinase, partial [Flavobacteriaceae bacterium]|nr:HAMP domain-containing histidine kinase [Flavobacteriaceae bacterium]